MARSALLFAMGHEFDEFLLAPIGEEKNGMVLSLLSAFARRNLDPWLEAARLSRLPRDVATQELSEFVAALPVGASGDFNAKTIAERLIRPLPKGSVSAAIKMTNAPTIAVSFGRSDAIKFGVIVFVLVGVILAAFLSQSGAPLSSLAKGDSASTATPLGPPRGDAK